MNVKTIRTLSKLDENSTEPALKIGGIVSAVVALFETVNVIAPDLLSEDTERLIFILAALLLPFITAAFTRGKVWSPASVKELVRESIASAESELNKEKERNAALTSILKDQNKAVNESTLPPIPRAEGSN